MRRHRNAKIVATLGPASSDAQVVEELFSAGVDVFRLNFSHGTAADHAQRVQILRQLEEDFEREIAKVQRSACNTENHCITPNALQARAKMMANVEARAALIGGKWDKVMGTMETHFAVEVGTHSRAGFAAEAAASVGLDGSSLALGREDSGDKEEELMRIVCMERRKTVKSWGKGGEPTIDGERDVLLRQCP